MENQGRINFNVANDFKGILGDVRLNGAPLYNWTITGYPLDNYEDIANLLLESRVLNQYQSRCDKSNRALLREGPTVFSAKFDIALNENEIQDTYLNPIGWAKVTSNDI